jgi:hypothetical protein
LASLLTTSSFQVQRAACVPRSLEARMRGWQTARDSDSINRVARLSGAAHTRFIFLSGFRAESRSNLGRLLLNQTKTVVLAYKSLLPEHHLGPALSPHMGAQKSHFEIFFAILPN